MKPGPTQTLSGGPVRIVEILEGTKEIAGFGVSASILGVYETSPGQFVSHIWLSDRRYALDPSIRAEMTLIDNG